MLPTGTTDCAEKHKRLSRALYVQPGFDGYILFASETDRFRERELSDAIERFLLLDDAQRVV